MVGDRERSFPEGVVQAWVVHLVKPNPGDIQRSEARNLLCSANVEGSKEHAFLTRFTLGWNWTERVFGGIDRIYFYVNGLGTT